MVRGQGAQAGEAREIFQGAIRAVGPDVLLQDVDLGALATRRLESYDRVWVIGMGKAALGMAAVLENRLNDRIDGGFVVTPRGYRRTLPARFNPPARIESGEGGHPLPDEGSLEAAMRVRRVAETARENDLVIVLISGGGSAVCAEFFEGISLDDAKRTYRLLVEAGLDIYAVNAVRKQISAVGGGRLAAAIHPAETLALVISDVVGDDLSVIASGPTSGDPSTAEDAVRVLQNADLWTAIPSTIRNYLQEQVGTRTNESLKPGDSRFRTVSNHIIAGNDTALRGAAETARSMGYDVHVLCRDITGEAREVGRTLVEEAMNARRETPTCFLAGGETSVTVRGSGMGGRNQEVALAAALALSGSDREATFLSAGTDGIDGPTDAAGAVITSSTVRMAISRGLNPAAHLQENDSYRFFEIVGGLIKTGPTHTNVMDIQVILT